jgi:hypothetical protein
MFISFPPASPQSVQFPEESIPISMIERIINRGDPVWQVTTRKYNLPVMIASIHGDYA